MVTHQVSRSLAVTLILTQMLGPVVVWALDQPGARTPRASRAVVSGLSGGELTATSPHGTQTTQFNETVGFRDELRTAGGTTAELLVNKHTLVTMLDESQVRLEEMDGHTVVHLEKGTVLLSTAASGLGENESVIVETPATHMTMRGGIVRATVGMASRQATDIPSAGDGPAHLVSRSSMRQAATETGEHERLEVYEGSVHLASRTGGETSLTLESGQSVQIIGGTLGPLSVMESSAIGARPVLLASSQHAATPASGMELVSQRQMDQVSALYQALFGDPDVEIEGKEKERGVIIATLFGAGPGANLFGTGNPYFAALLNAINRTGAGIGNDGTNSLSSVDPEANVLTGSVKGGLGLLTFTNLEGDPKKSSFHGTELLLIDSPGNPAAAPHGGAAPLSTFVGRGIQDQFSNPSVLEASNLSNLTFGTSATISDIDKVTFQPYEIKITRLPPPQPQVQSPSGQRIIFTGGQFGVLLNGQQVTLDPPNSTIARENSFSFERFIPNPDILPDISEDRSFLLRADFGGLRINLDFDRLPAVNDTFTISAVPRTPRIDGNTGVRINENYNFSPSINTAEDNPPIIRASTVAPFVIVPSSTDTRPVSIDGDDQKGALDVRPVQDPPAGDFPDNPREFIISDFSSRSDGKVCEGCKVSGNNGQFLSTSFVDGRITARSNSNPNAPVDLLGGVVLTNETALTLTSQITRAQGIEPSHTAPAIDGSVAAIVGTANAPAFVRIRDRVLAVLDGSTIQPASDNLRTSLLTVLDSQLTGPIETPQSTNTEGLLVRHRPNGEIPPLLELSSVDASGNPLVDGNGKPVRSKVTVTSAAVVRSSGAVPGLLDRALLEASSPILTLAHSQMTATGHLVDLAGANPNGPDMLRASLKTNDPKVPFDALVRLDRGSALNVAGNLLQVANRASATVDGYILSLANGSSLNIGGTLLSLAGNSILRLNSDAFGVFDHTANTLKLSNALCAGGECGLLTDHFNTPFQSSNGKPIQVSGSKSNVQLPQGFTPFRAPTGTASTVLVEEHTALFHVEPGSELHINNVPVVRR
jgi:hypothetical protein